MCGRVGSDSNRFLFCPQTLLQVCSSTTSLVRISSSPAKQKQRTRTQDDSYLDLNNPTSLLHLLHILSVQFEDRGPLPWRSLSTPLSPSAAPPPPMPTIANPWWTDDVLLQFRVRKAHVQMAFTMISSVEGEEAESKALDDALPKRRVSLRIQSRPKKKYSPDDGELEFRRVVKGKGSSSSGKRPKVERNQEPVLLERDQTAPRWDWANVDVNKGEDNEIFDGIFNGLGNLDDQCAYSRVKRTLRIFNFHHLQLFQEEEKRCKRGDATDDGNISAPEKVDDREKNSPLVWKPKGKKKASKSERDTKRSAKRPDLKAITRMRETKAILYSKGKLGHLPGIDVGHQFFSRAEMVVVGLHSHWLHGIDSLGKSFGKLEEYKSYTFPLAVSIVMSGEYEDDEDNSEEIVYTGEGGNDALHKKHQISNQKMTRGNLALKNSMDHGVPIRVTRGHVSHNSYCGKVYTYDGLYKVVEFWEEKGVSGFTVFKFRLKRLQGQPDLTTDQVRFAGKRVARSLSELRGLVCEDISGGREAISIPATNEVDDPPFAPTGYVYCKSILVPKGMKLPLDAGGCMCKGSCVDPKVCDCARLNGSNFPYVGKDGGRLVEAKDVVIECGPNCSCGPDCVNRASQQGLRYRLEVFRTPMKGWAVRSWDYIPSGAPVCEYTGILRRTDELDSVSDNNFIFEIDCLQTMEGLDGRQARLGDVSVHTKSHFGRSDDKRSESFPEFCIDAGSVGNVARFINHSCQPNLFVQCVLSSHHDIKLARVMLFAADNIPPLQELTYDYGYALDSVVGPDGNIMTMACYCSADDCRKRLY